MIVSAGPKENYDDWRSGNMADPTPIASAHPNETWAALGALIATIGGLVAVLYNRMNKDIEATDETVEALDSEFWSALEKLHSDINEIGRKVNAVSERVAQVSTAQAFVNTELDRICADVKAIEKVFTEIGVEHKHCMRLHQNILGGDNSHHGSH